MSKLNFVYKYLNSTISEFKVALLGYRTYKVALTQTGTNPPVASIIENTLGVEVQYQHDERDGSYYALFNQNLFTNSTTTSDGRKVEVTITPNSTVDPEGVIIQYVAYPVFFFVINIMTYYDGTLQDNLLGQNFTSILEVKVYNK